MPNISNQTGKTITFKWSGTTITGKITFQGPGVMGQRTTIEATDGVQYTLYGKCEVGNCGPFTVISIK